MIERNEASWNHSRKLRRIALDQVLARVRDDLEAAGVEDQVSALLYVALVEPKRGDAKDAQTRVSQALIVYGKPALERLVQACENALGQVASNIQAAEKAKKESIVKGKKGRGNVH